MAKSTKVIAALGVVAGLGVAALPLASYAADVTVTDTVTVNVAASCTFSTGGTNQAVGTSADINAGTVATLTNDTHAFTVKCNNNSYTVSAVATDLTNSSATAHGTIAYSTNAAYTADLQDGAVKSGVEDGRWTAVLTNGDTDKAISTTPSTIKSGNATVTDNFSVQYKAFAGHAQTGGAYTGTVTYTLTGAN